MFTQDCRSPSLRRIATKDVRTFSSSTALTGDTNSQPAATTSPNAGKQ